MKRSNVHGRASRASLALGALWACGAAQAPRASSPVGDRPVVSSSGPVHRVRFDRGARHLVVEALRDDLIHFEFVAHDPAPDPDRFVFTTPMIVQQTWPGPRRFTLEGTTVRTAEVEVRVDPLTLCATVQDLARGVRLTEACPDATANGATLTLSRESTRNVLGLGQEFIEPGVANGDWLGRVRSPGGPFGNRMVDFLGGANGNTQIPVMYALGRGRQGYALFLDDAYAQRWDLRSDPSRVGTHATSLRWYVFTGPDLPDLHADYMRLVGRPPVPPRRAFGLEVQEYGYDDWAELEGKLRGLRARHFPVDAFALDLQWFGGVAPRSEASHMGGLAFDAAHFPDAAAHIAALRDREGVGLVTIEESYISRGLPEHADLSSRGFLVREGEGDAPAYLAATPWWGLGGMLDWTREAAADYWHDTKRQALVDLGIVGHWTDLGEPEMYSPTGRYAGIEGLGAHEADVHNLYNFFWAASIARGYERHHTTARPFLLTRSGAAGIQRFGAAVWSGDIAATFGSLAVQQRAQRDMALSGIDYYSSDVGGFHREALGHEDLGDLFTRWLADAMAVDVPAHTHAENLCNCNETSPALLGDVPSNLANVRRRYALVPYLYSLAHRAYRDGTPVFPPPVFYDQDDPVLRELADEKLMGRDLLVAMMYRAGEPSRDVYLPAGRWFDFDARTPIDRGDGWLRAVPLRRDGVLRTPLFAREGAIVPLMHVDDQTMNTLGRRLDGSRRDELIARVFAGPAPTHFTQFDDDGTTVAYRTGRVRETDLAQSPSPTGTTVTVEPARGSYDGAPSARDAVIEFVQAGALPTRVTLDGVALPQLRDRAAWEAAPRGYYVAGPHCVIARSGVRPIDARSVFAFER